MQGLVGGGFICEHPDLDPWSSLAREPRSVSELELQVPQETITRCKEERVRPLVSLCMYTHEHTRTYHMYP